MRLILVQCQKIYVCLFQHLKLVFTLNPISSMLAACFIHILFKLIESSLGRNVHWIVFHKICIGEKIKLKRHDGHSPELVQQ